MKNGIFQAPAGKWFFKLYDEAGSAIFNSGAIYETQVDAFHACEAKMAGKEETTEEEAPKAKKVKKAK